MNAMNSIFPRAALLFAAALLLSTPEVRAQQIPGALCESGECQPAISAVEYGGRRAYKLTDGRAEAIIVPEIGRVMSFGKVGGPNLLWNLPNAPAKNQGWKNYGGDKTWLAPQSSWPELQGAAWPPDAALDGQAHQAEVLTGGKVRLTSPLSAAGIRLTRTLFFDANGEFVIEQTASKERGAPVRASLWNVCQIVPGEAVFLPCDESSAYPDGFLSLEKSGNSQKIEAVRPNLLRVVALNQGGGSKIGVDSPVSALASVRDGVAFVQKSAKPAGIYPDAQGGAGFPIEVYNFGNEQSFYSELELLGPLKTFAIGGKSTHTVRWSLHDLLSKDVYSPAVVEAIRNLLFSSTRNAEPTRHSLLSSIEISDIDLSRVTCPPALPELTTLINLPECKEIQNFQIEAGLSNNKEAIGRTEFQQLISASTVVTADNPLLKEWHYAPWCQGSFSVGGKTYKFGLYLGGLGWLQTPQGQRGMFSSK